MIHKFKTAGVVYHGEGSISVIPQIIEDNGWINIGLVRDPGVPPLAAVGNLNGLSGIQVFEFNAITPEPSVELVGNITGFFKDKHIDVLISIGGGSCIDISKMVSVLLRNSGMITDYFGVDKVPVAGIPLLAIPTTSGTGSEVSPAAIFYDTADGTKKGVRSDYLYPDFVILDPEITYTLPPSLTASTGIDALTHAIEGLTSRNATQISSLFAREAIRLIGLHLRTAVTTGSHKESRMQMQMASYFAGICLAIANVGAVHALAQTIGGMYKISHGVANAFLLPHVMEFNLSECVPRYKEIALLLGEDSSTGSDMELAKSGVQAVRDLVQDLNIHTLPELKRLRRADYRDIAERCMASQLRLLELNLKRATADDLERIMRDALHSMG